MPTMLTDRTSSTSQALVRSSNPSVFLPRPNALRTPDQELKQTYHRRIEAARSEMRRFGISSVPTLLVGDDTERQLLPGNLLFGRFDLLVSQLQVA